MRCGFVITAGICAILVVAIFNSLSPATEQAARQKKNIVFGYINSEATRTILKFQPFADYLANRLSQHGIETGQVKAAPDVNTMAEWMKAGEVDFFMDSFYSAMSVAEKIGASPILYRTRGKPDKSAVFFTRIDSGISTLSDLNGKLISFDEPTSNSGYMLPKAHLIRAGMRPAQKRSFKAPISADEVGYLFSGADEVTVQLVISGKVAAGAADNETFSEFAKANPGAMKVISETETLFRDFVVVAKPDMEKSLQDGLKTALLGMDKNDKGKTILEKIMGAKRFAEFLGEREQARAKAQALFDLIKGK